MSKSLQKNIDFGGGFMDPSMPSYKKKYQSPYFDHCALRSHEMGKGSTNFPYTLEPQIEGRQIEINGMHHINDPEDVSIKKLEKRMIDFIDKSDRPIVFVEGGLPELPEGITKEEAIIKYGEPGLLTWVANKRGVEVTSPEPPLDYEVKELLKMFKPEEVMQYYFSRQLLQWYRNKDKDKGIGPAKEYIENKIKSYSLVPGLEEMPQSYEHYADIFASEYSLRPEEMSEELAVKKLQSESFPESNSVSARSGDIRDEYIMQRIKDEAKEGRDVFLAYGSFHVFKFEQMLSQN